jgi:hypothetical protein
MPYQTTANSNAFVMGGCIVYISGSTDTSTATGSFLNLGAARGVKITESWDAMEVETDNTPPVIVGAKNQSITVEGNLLELNFQKINFMRSGMSSFSTTTFTLNTGGSLTIRPQAVYLKYTAPASSSDTIIATIYYATLTEGLTIPYTGDDKTDVAEIPFKFKGVCQSTRTAGQQLFNIVDGRSSVYAADYSQTTP